MNPAARLEWKFALEYLLDGRTPARAATDSAFAAAAPHLYGDGTIVELGSAGDYYRKFFPPSQEYLLTNFVLEGDARVDMTSMPYASNSVAAFVSVYALEHVFDFERALAESHRCLRPGGRMILVSPFLYYWHAAPDDYFRFSKSALLKLLEGFQIDYIYPIGNRGMLFAEFLHEKTILGSRRGSLARLALRIAGLPFLCAGLKSQGEDNPYAMGYLVLAQKRA